jgi:hypothetical protein
MTSSGGSLAERDLQEQTSFFFLKKKKEGNEGEEGLLQQSNPNLISKGGQGLGGCGIVANVWGIDSKSCHKACLFQGTPHVFDLALPAEKREKDRFLQLNFSLIRTTAGRRGIA